jgi:hypothetical protein
MKHLFHAACVAAAIVTGPALAATELAGPQGLLKGQVPDNAAGLKRVAVTNFVVQFVTDLGVEMKRSNNTFHAKLVEVTPEQYQAAADALYEQLVTELKAAGIDVVPRAEVAAHPAIAELQRIGSKGMAVVNDSSIKKLSTLAGAAQLPMVLALVPDQKLPKYHTDVPEGTYAKDLLGWEQQQREWLRASNAEVMSLSTIFGSTLKLAEDLKATALSVRLAVPFVDIGIEKVVGGGGLSLFGGGDKGKVVANPRFVEGGTVFLLAQGGGNPGHVAQQVLALQQPVPVAGLKLDIVKGARKDDGGVVGALFRAAGGDSDKADYVVKTDGATLAPALAASAQPIFKELAQALAAAK